MEKNLFKKDDWYKLRHELVMAYHPALLVERLVPFAVRHRTHSILGWLTAGVGVLVLALAPWLNDPHVSLVRVLDFRLLGIFFLLLAAWLVSCCLRALQYYYRDRRWPLAETLFRSKATDPVKGFVHSRYGRDVLGRLGAIPAHVATFLKNREAIIPATALSLPLQSSFADYVLELTRADTRFAHFIFSLGVAPLEVALFANKYIEAIAQEHARRCWWSRESLARIPVWGTSDEQARITVSVVIKNAEPRHTLVEEFLEKTTGLPYGGLNESERSRLAYLEKILKHRLLGRDETLHTVIEAAKRARVERDVASVDVANDGKPLGSFLLFGPTESVMQETVQALGDIFFGPGALATRAGIGGEAAWEQLNMAGFSGEPESLSGILRERPYGVLVLDNFEKVAPAAATLLSQILEEGFFSDDEGRKIDCRNIVFIAIFQPAPEVLWDAIARGTSLSHARELALERIAQEGLLSRLLADRFDGKIVFHPLALLHAERLARLQLEKVAARLATQGYTLAITDELVRYIVEASTGHKLGAMPLSPQTIAAIEQAVITKASIGNFSPAGVIVLSTRDFTGSRV